MSDHHMLIPAEGLIHVFHADKPLDIRATLAANSGTGTYMAMGLLEEGNPVGMVHWFVDDTAPVNPRARQALAEIGDVHMIFTGPVMFSDVNIDVMGRIVIQLSSGGATE